MRTITITALVVLAATSGCVSAGKYDAAVADAERARLDLKRTQTASGARINTLEAEIADLRRSIAETQKRLSASNTTLQGAEVTARGCAQALDEATALNQGLRKELERLGKDVDQLLSARGALATSLAEARARLEELRRAQAAAEARAQLFQELALKLKRMVDAGDLQIKLRSGRMVLVLPTDVLFDSGRAEVKKRGKEAIAELARVLATVRGRRFQVAGHTDDEPIRVSGFASNWELSTERGLEVTRILLASGMEPGTLSAAGYGEFDPLVPNDSREQKAMNRRIEITVQPNIEELVAVPERR